MNAYKKRKLSICDQNEHNSENTPCNTITTMYPANISTEQHTIIQIYDSLIP